MKDSCYETRKKDKEYISKIQKAIQLDCFYGVGIFILTEFFDGKPSLDYKTLDEAIKQEKTGVKVRLDKKGCINYYPVNQDKQNIYYYNIIVKFGSNKIIYNAQRLGCVDADYTPTVFCIEKNKIVKKSKEEIEKIIFGNFNLFVKKYHNRKFIQK